ncbi:hypothetical protein [Streptomyces ortus]|uniref:Uncharacterized protein n=1 Tax=Streptomyces ortus TaxID=2867268 RepID=A0ABT3VA51_9ACTN|nr:hypothetical protein [Streptomyces ortus]MCX4235834.1 hypothetical protein [Streptomyces ortus]
MCERSLLAGRPWSAVPAGPTLGTLLAVRRRRVPALRERSDGGHRPRRRSGGRWGGRGGRRRKLPTAAVVALVVAHDNQVIGVVPAPAHMNCKKGLDNANELCGNKFESTWAPDVERVGYGCIADEYSWNQ